MRVKYYAKEEGDQVIPLVFPVIHGAIHNAGLHEDIRREIPQGLRASSFEVHEDNSIIISLVRENASWQTSMATVGYLKVQTP